MPESKFITEPWKEKKPRNRAEQLALAKKHGVGSGLHAPNQMNRKKMKTLAKGSVKEEQLDEISSELARRYKNKAAKADVDQESLSVADAKGWYKSFAGKTAANKVLSRRKKGLEMANKRLGEEEEYDMNEDENETEIQEPNLSDLVVHAIDQKPLDFQQSFADLMQQRIADSVYDKKLEIASTFIEPSQYEDGEDEEPEEIELEDEEGEVEETPEETSEEE